MPNYNLGVAQGTIIIKYDGAGASKAEESLGRVEKKTGSVNQALGKVSTGVLVAGGVIAAGFALAVRAAANFEQRLSAIQAVSGATTAEMEKIRAKALQLGKDTVFSASDAATAMEELVKAGISVNDVLTGAADAVVNLAAAGGIDLPQAATIAANAMNVFGLSGKDMVHISDLIAGAANSSAIDVHEFGLSLAQSGAVAHLAGLNFDDLAVAIAEMGNAGIKGSDAGTSLKSFLTNLIPTTKKQIEVSKQLGLITKDGTNAFFDQTGKLKPLVEVQRVLQSAMAGLSKEQQLATLNMLFGSDAIRAASVLADNGAAGFDKLAASIGKTSAADVAKTRMNNLKGSTEQLKGSIETLAIQIGTILIPFLRGLVDGMNRVVGVFIGLPGPAKAVIVVVLALLGASLLLAGSFIKVYQATVAMRTAIAGVRAALAAHKAAAIAAALANETLARSENQVALGALGMGAKLGSAAGIAAKLGPLALLVAGIADQNKKLAKDPNGWWAERNPFHLENWSLHKKKSKESTQAQDEFTKAADESKRAIDAENKSIQDQAVAQAKALAAAAPMAAMLGVSAQAYVDAGKSAESAAAGQAANTLQMRIANDAAGLLKQGFDRLNSTLLDQSDADIAFRNSVQSMTDAVAANGKSLDITTKAGRDNTTALHDAIRAAQSHATAVATATGSSIKAEAAYKADEKALIAAAHAAGLSDSAIAAMIKRMGGVPKDIRTRVEAETAVANAKIAGVQARINAFTTARHLAHVNVTAQNVAAVEEQLNKVARDRTTVVTILSLNTAADINKHRSMGGLVGGVGTSTSDSNVVALSRKEYVIKAESVASLGVPFLNALNRYGAKALSQMPASSVQFSGSGPSATVSGASKTFIATVYNPPQRTTEEQLNSALRQMEALYGGTP